MLNENENDSTNYEVINTGVPGYNTAMEVAVLENKIDLSQVDLVITNFIENDFDLPNFIRKKPPYGSLMQSFIRRQLFPENLNSWKEIDARLHESPFDTTGYYEKDPENVPDIYKDMVGEKNYLAAMQKLKDLSEKHNFQLILLSNSLYKERPKSVTDFAEKSNIPYLDVRNSWWDGKVEFNNKTYKISAIDWHPNRYEHTCNARILYKKVKEILLYWTFLRMFFEKTSSKTSNIKCLSSNLSYFHHSSIKNLVSINSNSVGFSPSYVKIFIISPQYCNVWKC